VKGERWIKVGTRVNFAIEIMEDTDGIKVLNQNTIQGEMETMDMIIDQMITTFKVISMMDGDRQEEMSGDKVMDGIQMVVDFLLRIVIIIKNGKNPVVLEIKIILSGKTVLSILQTNMVLLTKAKVGTGVAEVTDGAEGRERMERIMSEEIDNGGMIAIMVKEIESNAQILHFLFLTTFDENFLLAK